MSKLTTLQIAKIRIEGRVRQDLGDVRGLADSIARVGLLHPVVVTPDHRLVSGARRLAAARLLGWTEIPVHVIENLTDALPLLLAERDENVERKAFTPEEVVDGAALLEPLEKAAAKERERQAGSIGGKAKGRETFTHPSKGKSRDKVAAAMGVSAPTLRKAQAVVTAARKEPEKFTPLVTEMNRTGKVDGAHKDLLAAKREDRLQERRNAASATCRPNAELLHGDLLEAGAAIPDSSIHAIITDPPYGREWLPVYERLSELAERVLVDGGVCLVMTGQAHLEAILRALTSKLTYVWTLACFTPGASVQVFGRRVKSNWKPIVYLCKGKPAWEHVSDVIKSAGAEKQHHDWQQNETLMAEIIKAFSVEGQTILDPFCGSGSTGVAALDLKRRFVGIDTDEAALTSARRRLGLAE